MTDIQHSPKSKVISQSILRDRIFAQTTYTITVDHSPEPLTETIVGWANSKARLQAIRDDYDHRGIKGRIWAIAASAPFVAHVFDADGVPVDAVLTDDARAEASLVPGLAKYTDEKREHPRYPGHMIPRYHVVWETIQAPKVRRKLQRRPRSQYVSPLYGFFGYAKADGIKIRETEA